MMVRSSVVVLVVFVVVACGSRPIPSNYTPVCDGACANAEVKHIGMNKVMPLKEVEFNYCRFMGHCPTTMKAVTLGAEVCSGGSVDVHQNENGMGAYDCSNVDLMSYVAAADLGSSGDTSDIWGATIVDVDGEGTDKYVAIVGHSDGTSFVDITNSLVPIVLGFLPTYDCGDAIPYVCGKNRIWRDIKVYNDRAYIVSENWAHGLQVIDIRNLFSEELRKGHARVHAGETPQTLTADYHYSDFGNAHNIALNVDSGYAYIVGSNKCSGGLYVMNVMNNPPTFAGCFDADGYTHDVQCVNYAGDGFPDPNYQNKEICFAYNEDTLTIVDVSDKSAMTQISRISYNGAAYTHQGWLTSSGKFLLLDDELDEQEGTTYTSDSDTQQHGAHTRTMVWNVEDLADPQWVSTYLSEQTAIDHNLYIVGNKAYQSNYCAGLRVLELNEDDEDNLDLTEYAYFDVAPYCSGPSFEGTWSNYPYYDGHPDNQGGLYNLVAVSSIERGLYMLRVAL